MSQPCTLKKNQNKDYVTFGNLEIRHQEIAFLKQKSRIGCCHLMNNIIVLIKSFTGCIYSENPVCICGSKNRKKASCNELIVEGE